MRDASITDAQSAYIYVKSLLDAESIDKNFHYIHRVDVDNTPDNLTRIRFLDGSVLRINYQTLTIELS